MRKDDDERDALVERGLACVQAGRSPRAASPPRTRRSPTRRPIPLLAIRIGFGQGDELVERQWEQAIELPRETQRASAQRGAAPAGAHGGSARPARHRRSRARSSSCVPAPTLDARPRAARRPFRLRVGAGGAPRRAREAHRPRPGRRTSTSSTERRRATGDAANEALQGASVGRARRARSRRRSRSASAS